MRLIVCLPRDARSLWIEVRAFDTFHASAWSDGPAEEAAGRRLAHSARLDRFEGPWRFELPPIP